MKKKLIFAIAIGFFAVATVFNMNMLQSNDAGDISLESIAVMAQAKSESWLVSWWNASSTAVVNWWESKIYACKTISCTTSSTSYYVGAGAVAGVSGSVTYGITSNGNPAITTTVNAGMGLGVEFSATTTYRAGTIEECIGGGSVAHCWNCKNCS